MQRLFLVILYTLVVLNEYFEDLCDIQKISVNNDLELMTFKIMKNVDFYRYTQKIIILSHHYSLIISQMQRLFLVITVYIGNHKWVFWRYVTFERFLLTMTLNLWPLKSHVMSLFSHFTYIPPIIVRLTIINF